MLSEIRVIFSTFWTFVDNDLRLFKLKIETPVTPAMENVHTNFGLLRYFLSELRARVGQTVDGQPTDGHDALCGLVTKYVSKQFVEHALDAHGGNKTHTHLIKTRKKESKTIKQLQNMNTTKR